MSATPNPPGRTVLVIDDDALVREVVTAILEDAGYAVLGTAGGAEAAALLESRGGAIHAVLLDLVLPGSSPEDLVAQIRAHAPDAPLIIASGRSTSEVGDAAERFGSEGFLRKPFGAEELLATLRAALDR